MASHHFEFRNVRGHRYLYVVEKARTPSGPRNVKQVYLGTPDHVFARIWPRYETTGKLPPVESRQRGATPPLSGIAPTSPPALNYGAAVRAVDIFCGAGGLTRGLLDAGIDVRAGYDLDRASRYPYTANNGVPFVEADVRTLSPADVKALLGPEPNLLAGCAPCQPYSIMTNRGRGHADPRASLLGDFARIVEGVLPTYIVVENVPGLAKSDVFRQFVSRLETLGYKVDSKVVDASRYGVPQHRVRLVLVASSAGPIALPRPKRGRSPTVRGAIEGLPPLTAGRFHSLDPLHTSASLSHDNLRRIRASVPGGTWHDWPQSMKLPCQRTEGGQSYRHSYGRMRWDTPSPPITTKFFNLGSGRYGHPEQNRALSLREGAILQTFPVGYSFFPPGKRPQMRVAGRLIGNAVPVRLAEAIGRTIVEHAASKGLPTPLQGP